MLKPYSDKNFFLYVSVFLFSLSSLSFLLLSSYQISADDYFIDDVSLAVPISCSMSGVGMNTHNATITNGTYQDDIGTTTLKVFCNDTSGFAIYAAGYTNNTIGETDSNKLVGTTSGLESIVTGLATTAGNPDVSNWAMKLTLAGDSGDTSGTNALTIDSAPNVSGGADASFNNYHTVPNEFTKVAHKSAATSMDETTGGATLTTTYAAYISKTQAADTYQGQVIYTLVHPATNVPNQERTCPASKVCYWPNAGDMTVGGVGVVDTMGDQVLTAETTLWASNFKRAGYGFVGWSDKYDWELNANDANGNGTGNNADYHIYGPNQTLTLNTSDYSGTNGGLSLYAVWAPSAGSLQGWSGCSSLGSGKVTALTDARDQDTYAVAKLADGKCWMIENLRLDYNANITTANTQSNNGAFGGVFAGLAQPETNLTVSLTVANSLYYSGTQSGTATIDIGVTDSPGNRFPRYRNDNTNTNIAVNPNINVANMTGYGQNVYSYGNYYNWPASIADTNLHNVSNQSVTTTSLCPTGWRLPQGGNKARIELYNDNDFWNLVVDGLNGGIRPINYDSSTQPKYAGSSESGPVSKKIRNYPNNFVYSGNVSNSSLFERGSGGKYVTSTAVGLNYSIFIFNGTDVYPGTDWVSNANGDVIRCIAGS